MMIYSFAFISFATLCLGVKAYSPLTDYALEFHTKNVSDYVHIWGMPNLTKFTVCFWMKSNDSDEGALFSYAVPDEANELLIISNNTLDVRIRNDKRDTSVSANDGDWHHICSSWENTAGVLKFYKDGVMSANYTNFKTGYMIRSGGSLVLGQKQDAFASGFSGAQSFQGLFTNLNVWDYVLCSDVIEKMSKACIYDELEAFYKWSDLKHGVKGRPRVLVPSPCDPPADGEVMNTCSADRCYSNDHSSLLSDYALEFPNKNVTDYVHIWGMPALTKFTVCFWMKTNDSNRGTPFSYAVPQEANELLITGYENFAVWIGGTEKNLSVSANDDKWHHICLTWKNNNGSLKFYKDSVLHANFTDFKTEYNITSGGSLVLGQLQGSLAGSFSSDQSYQGLLTNVNVWDYVLCPDAIERMFKGCLFVEPGTVYRWPDLKHGVKGKPRILVPSPCDPLDKGITSTPSTAYYSTTAHEAEATVTTSVVHSITGATSSTDAAKATTDAAKATTNAVSATTAVDTVDVTSTTDVAGATTTADPDTMKVAASTKHITDFPGATSKATGTTTASSVTATTTTNIAAETTITPSTIHGSRHLTQSSLATSNLFSQASTTATRTITAERPTDGDVSSTKVTPTENVVVPTGLGPEVLITLTVKTDCPTNNFLPSSREYQALETSLSSYVGKLYRGLRLKKAYVKGLTCLSANSIRAVVNATFGIGNPTDTDIKKMLGDEIDDGSLYDMPVDSSEFDTKFLHVTMGFEMMAGECKRVCCGAGGPVVMVQTCTPPNRCEGIGSSTKEESGHCPFEDKATCKDLKCGATGSCPSFAIIVLLTVLSFYRMTDV